MSGHSSHRFWPNCDVIALRWRHSRLPRTYSFQINFCQLIRIKNIFKIAWGVWNIRMIAWAMELYKFSFNITKHLSLCKKRSISLTIKQFEFYRIDTNKMINDINFICCISYKISLLFIDNEMCTENSWSEQDKWV